MVFLPSVFRLNTIFRKEKWPCISEHEGMSTSSLFLDEKKRKKMCKTTPNSSLSPLFASFYCQGFLTNKVSNMNISCGKSKPPAHLFISPGEGRHSYNPFLRHGYENESIIKHLDQRWQINVILHTNHSVGSESGINAWRMLRTKHHGKSMVWQSRRGSSGQIHGPEQDPA